MSYLYNETLGSTIYDTNYTNQINNIKNKYYNEQKKNVVDPTHFNIVAPYARTMFNDQVMGPVSNEIKTDSVGFDKQFELAKFDNRNGPKSANQHVNNDKTSRGLSATKSINPLTDGQWTQFSEEDTDMTYGVVDKKDFLFETMVPFTARRELIYDNDKSNSSLYLSNFTGVGLKPKKHEIEAFFKPEDSKKETHFVNMNSDEMRDRYMSSNSIKQNGQRPFEPEQVGPGLGLPYNVQNLGGLHDDTRIIYKTSNELRNKLNPQVTYTAPVKPGRLGDAGTTSGAYGDVKHYRPDKFTEWSLDTIWAGRSATNASQAPLPYIMKDTTRIKSIEQVGPSNFSVSQYSPDTYGQLTEPFRQNLAEFPTVSNGGAIKSIRQGKDNSYQIPETQRDTTNYDINGPAGMASTLSVVAPYTDDAKGTVRQTTNQPFNTTISAAQQSTTSMYSDDAKGTVRQVTNQPFNTTLSAPQQATTSMYSDDAKSTVRQVTNQPFNTMAAPQQAASLVYQSDQAKGTVRQVANQPFNTNIGSFEYAAISQLLDDAKSTVRQTTNQPFNTTVSASQYATTSMYSDDAKSTVRQTTNQPFNTTVSASQYATTSMYSDDAKGTVRQETNQPFNTMMSSAQQSTTTAFTDDAKGTIRQTTNKSFNTNLTGPQQSVVAAYLDDAKGTIRQETNKPFNTNITGTDYAVKVQLSDQAKATIKQDTLLEDYISGGGADSLNKLTTYLQDQAKGTIKQDTLIENYISGGGADNLNKLTTYLQDQAKGTIKQDTMLENYMGNVVEYMANVTTRTNYKNIESSDGRETVSKQRAPTWKGYADTPSVKQVNMMLKDAATYESYLNPNKANEVLRTDFMQIAKRNDVQQTQQIFDKDFINIMGNTLTHNTLVNNLVYRGSYDNNPVNTFIFNKS